MRTSFLCILALSAFACSNELAPTTASGALSSGDVESHAGLSLTLDAREDARSFNLARAVIDVSGPASVTLRAPRDVVNDTLSTPLPSGSYATFLRPGFTVTEELPDRSSRAVEAELISANPTLVHLNGASVATLSFHFRIDGHTVVIGKAHDVRLSASR